MLFTSHGRLVALSLAATLACTVDKGDDTTAGTTESASATDTDGASTGPGTTADAPTTAGETTAGDPSGDTLIGTDTGDESTSGTTGEVDGNPPCIDTPTVLGPGDPSPFGFTGEELLADKLGERVSVLKFASEPLSLSDDIKGLELPLTFGLRHEGGEIRFIDSEPNPDFDDSGNESGFQECLDRVEVDVLFDFVTDGGELDEHRPGVLVAESVERASLRVELLPPGLMGSLDPTALYDPAEDPPWVVTGIEIGATFDAELAGGSLLNEVNVGGDDGFAGFGSIAGFGDELF
jgi:hypothetical protein